MSGVLHRVRSTPMNHRSSQTFGMLVMIGDEEHAAPDCFRPTHHLHAADGGILYAEITGDYVCTLALASHAGITLVIASEESRRVYSSARMAAIAEDRAGRNRLVFRDVILEEAGAGDSGRCASTALTLNGILTLL